MAKFDKDPTNRQIELFEHVQRDLANGTTTTKRVVRYADRPTTTPLRRKIMLNALVNYNLKHSTFINLDLIQAVEVADA